jgi:hypothetical protein
MSKKKSTGIVTFELCECRKHGHLFLDGARSALVISKRQGSTFVSTLLKDGVIDRKGHDDLMVAILDSGMEKEEITDDPKWDARLIRHPDQVNKETDIGCTLPHQHKIPFADLVEFSEVVT